MKKDARGSMSGPRMAEPIKDGVLNLAQVSHDVLMPAEHMRYTLPKRSEGGLYLLQPAVSQNRDAQVVDNLHRPITAG